MFKNDETNSQEFCIVSVIYKTPPTSSGGGSGVGSSWELDLTTTQHHITHVTEEDKQVHYPSTANDVGQAIGVTADSIDGIDIEIPQGAIQITNYKPSAEVVTAEYITNINTIGGHVNNELFLNIYEPGEVLYLGARMGYSETADSPLIRVDHFFKVEKNIPGLVVEIEGQMESIAKEGWQYQWFRNVDKIEEVAGVRVKKRLIKSAHVATVYNKISFALLNIEFTTSG